MCKAYAESHPGELRAKTAPFAECTVGAATHDEEQRHRKIQLEDFLRHGGVSKSKQRSKFHQKALRWLVGCDSAAELPLPGPGHDQIDAHQLRISCMVLHRSLSAQAEEYDRRATEASRIEIDQIWAHAEQ